MSRLLDLDAIRNAHPLPAVVGAWVKLQRAGHEWKACCPFHDDRSPSFTIYADGRRFQCFGCGAGGALFDALKLRFGVTIREAAEMLGEGHFPKIIIPPRRNTITAVVAPGGVGKSSLMATTILALATGRALLGKTIWEGPQRVWYWNLEDDGDELSRQIHAAALHHCVGQEDCADRLFVDSGLDGATLCVATEDQDGFKILHPVIEALVAELTGRKMDVLIVDPLVSSHTVSENDNGAIDAVAKEWARVAKRANCSIVLVHHTKKLGGQKVTAEMSRGAVALINAARIALVLNRMDSEEATRFGIAEDGERRRHFNVQDDKHNRAPAEDAEWYRMASVDLGNGEGIGTGDNIGVVARWTPPNTFDGVTTEHLRDVDSGGWRKSDQSPEWVGQVVARVLDLDLTKNTDKARAKRLIKEWLSNGALAEETRKDGKGNDRPFVVVGRWVDDHSSPPHQPVRKGVEVGPPFLTTTAPKRAVVVVRNAPRTWRAGRRWCWRRAKLGTSRSQDGRNSTMSDEHLIRRYSVSLMGSGKLRFIRRPLTIPPTANTLCFVDRGSADRADRYGVAKFEEGQWLDERGRPFKIPPIFWTELDSDA